MFIKISAPWEVLSTYAEVMRFKMPVKEVSVSLLFAYLIVRAAIFIGSYILSHRIVTGQSTNVIRFHLFTSHADQLVLLHGHVGIPREDHILTSDIRMN